ncbi:MAG: sacsin N-terminal ATP-binding-like domain-containing protein [Streptosporangiales bacterium]
MTGADDPFHTAALRTRVLDAWSASPARFREDANTEEDHALGGYRDRLVVELAQNAADAATRAGVAGRLRLSLNATELRAANTGVPLSADGVESLSTLRASEKRDGESVGRFGVGFSAVRTISDSPRVLSRTGAVRWSRSATLDEVRDLPSVAAELARRDDQVPVLRLPFTDAGEPRDGFDTEVVLPLRDDAAAAYARRLFADAGPALLLGLPALRTVQIAVDGVVRELRARWADDARTVAIDDGGSVTRWRLSTGSGSLAPELLADRPVEERVRPHWSVAWAVPVTDDDVPRALPSGVSPVLHAPTPSDESIDLPGVLLASFPLDPARRHVAPGPLTDHLVERAAQAYVDLVADLPPSADVLELVPGPVAAGQLDSALRQVIGTLLPECAFLPGIGGGLRMRPVDAVAADAPGGLLDVLAEVLPALLPARWAARRRQLGWLGVRRLALADVVDLLSDLDRPPQWWHRVYAALMPADTDPLGALPVPLADGRTVRGPRGVLLPSPGLDVAALAAIGLRVADADAVHPLLLRLGAVEATPRALLEDPNLRAAVAESCDAEDPDTVAAAVLPAVQAVGLEAGEEPWLGALALRDADGSARPADELLLPGAPLSRVMSSDAPFGFVASDLVDRWGPSTLERVGVLATFSLVRDEDVPLDAGECDHDLDGEDEWVAETLEVVGGAGELPSAIPEFVAVRDLDLVDPARWDDALALLARPPLRAAMVEPAVVVASDGRHRHVPSYTTWWLRGHPVLAGHRPGDLRDPDADDLLAELYDDAPAGDPALLGALGVRTTLEALLAEPGGPADLLDRLADPDHAVEPARLAELYAALATVDPQTVNPPDYVRVAAGARTRVGAAAETVVLDAPDLLPLLGFRDCIVVRHDRAERLAAVLDVPLASTVVPGRVESTGSREPVAGVLREVLPGLPDGYLAHDPLLVDGVEVDWRCTGREVHAASLAGLARGLAWYAGRWESRHLLAALLDDPASAPALLTEARLDVPTLSG